MATIKCTKCAGDLVERGRSSILANSAEQPVCNRCKGKLLAQFAGVLALLGLSVALSPVLVDMPAGLFVAFGGGLILVAGVVYWRTRHIGNLAGLSRGERSWLPGRLAEDANARFSVAIFGTWLLAYYVANLACGEWNPLLVGCNSTCKTIMWGSLASMAALSTAYVMGYRKAIWPMLGVTVVQNYPHCQCENGLYIQAIGVQPFCLIVPTLVGIANLWMMRIGTYKPLGFALTLSLLAGALAVAITHRLGIPIALRLEI